MKTQHCASYLEGEKLVLLLGTGHQGYFVSTPETEQRIGDLRSGQEIYKIINL